jgi:hypothetical protein
MGIITVNIVVNNIGADTGPFDIYDNYTGLLITNVSKQDLLSGVSLDIRENATQITVVSKGICNNNLVVPITTFPLSPTPSPTPSISVSVTPSITPSISETPSLTPSSTPSITVSPSIIVSRTPSVTPSISISTTPSITPSISISVTPSLTPSISISSTPSVTPSLTPSISISRTPSISATPSVTPSTSQTPFPTLFLPLSQISETDVCNNGELGGYTWILGSRSDTSLCDTSFVRNTSSSILDTIGIGNFFWLKQGSNSRKFQVQLFSFGEFAGELYGLAVETCSACVNPSVTPSITPSVSRTPSITVSRTPTVTPSISISRTPTVSPTPSTSVPCCTYYDLTISSTDTNASINNTIYPNGIVYANYTDCYDTPQSLGYTAGIYTNAICVKPGTFVNLIYYTEDNPVVASFSTAYNTDVCCSAYPPPTASPTPSVSISKTPTPSITAGISSTPSISPTPTPTVTPIGPEGFIFTDIFLSNNLLDCTGEGDLGLVSTWEYTITIVNNCTSQTTTNAISNLSFTVDLGGGFCGTDNITINAGSNTYSSTYERSNACTGLICNAEISSSPGTLTQC